MPRPLRIVVPGVPLHVVQRGTNRARTFHDATDLQRFYQCLGDASATYGCAIHAYVLMSNHFHLLLSPADETSPGRMMQQLGRTFGPWLNARHRRTGALWEGRFRSSLIETPHYFFACSRYIELNAVRAGIVDTPNAYPWSSYRANALGVADVLLTRHRLYDALGADAGACASAYRGLFTEPVPPDVTDTLRRAVRTGTGRPQDGGRCDERAA